MGALAMTGAVRDWFGDRLATGATLVCRRYSTSFALFPSFPSVTVRGFPIGSRVGWRIECGPLGERNPALGWISAFYLKEGLQGGGEILIRSGRDRCAQEGLETVQIVDAMDGFDESARHWTKAHL